MRVGGALAATVSPVYARSDDRVDDRSAAIGLLRCARFVQLVSHDHDGGFAATGLPMLVDADGQHLVGHLARANPQWRSLDGAPALVIAPLSDGYVSPDWYPSKHEGDGRVVPTWNYEAVHVHGTARIHHDESWLRELVSRLTDTHEAARSDGGEPWAVTDAPADFVDRMLGGIVGVTVAIDRIEAKRKLSGNRSEADRRGVLDGLGRTTDVPERLLTSMAESAGVDPGAT